MSTGPYVIVWYGPEGPRRWHALAGIPYDTFESQEEAEKFRIEQMDGHKIAPAARSRHKVIPLAQFLVEAGQ